jgi:hypothetical protein
VISRRRAMPRRHRLRRRPALSFASARLFSPCGRAVFAVIAHRALHGAVAEPVVAKKMVVAQQSWQVYSGPPGN